VQTTTHQIFLEVYLWFKLSFRYKLNPRRTWIWAGVENARSARAEKLRKYRWKNWQKNLIPV